MARKDKNPQEIPVKPQTTEQMRSRLSKALDKTYSMKQDSPPTEMPSQENVFDTTGGIRFVVQKISVDGRKPIISFTFGWGPRVDRPPVNIEWFIIECHSIAYEMIGQLRPVVCELIGNNFLAINYLIPEEPKAAEPKK
jgi:hypothetical protein